jgi:hypothetical protein
MLNPALGLIRMAKPLVRLTSLQRLTSSICGVAEKTLYF